jgi:hypothetical protein
MNKHDDCLSSISSLALACVHVRGQSESLPLSAALLILRFVFLCVCPTVALRDVLATLEAKSLNRLNAAALPVFSASAKAFSSSLKEDNMSCVRREEESERPVGTVRMLLLRRDGTAHTADEEEQHT